MLDEYTVVNATKNIIRRNNMQKKKRSNFLTKKGFKFFSTLAMIFALVASPFSMALNPGQGSLVVQKNQAEAAGLADIALLSGQSLDASYNATTKELRLNIKGLVLLNLGLVTEQNYTYQLPSEFREILELDNFKDAARIEYDQKLLLGLISVSQGTLSGDDIDVDAANGIVAGTRFATLDLAVASNMKAELIINLGALGYELPSSDTGQLKFYGTATKTPLIDLPLLSSEGASDVIATNFNNDLTANPVTDQDTVVTGIKKSSSGVLGSAEVRVYDGNTLLGSTSVATGSNIRYSVTIPKQPAGKELTIQIYTRPAIGSWAPTGEPLTLTVIDTTAPEAPAVSPVTDTDTVVTGTGEVGATVTVVSPASGESWTGTVDTQGNYSVTIPVQVGGTELAVTLTDAAGNKSEPTGVVVEDTTAPDAPVVNGVTDEDTKVTGTGEPGSTVTVVTPDDEYTGTVDENGGFSVEIPTQTPGTDITVNLKDDAGNKSGDTTITVTNSDTTAPEAPIVNEVTDSATEVTGSAEPGSTVEVTFPNGDKATGTADGEGNFTVTIPDGVELEVGDIIDVTATDEAGNVSGPTTVTVTDTPDTTVPVAPTVNEVTDSATKVTGLAEPGSTVEVTFPNGEMATGIADKKGNFTVTIPDGVELGVGDEIKVTATDVAGNESDPTLVKVVLQITITVNPIIEGDDYVTGQASTKAKTVRLVVNGEVLRIAPISAAGSYRISIKTVKDETGKMVKAKAGDVVKIEYYDREYTHINAETIIKENPTKPVTLKVNPITEGDDYVTGQASTKAKTVRLVVNGEVLRIAPISADGSYRISIKTVKDETGKMVKAKVGDVVKIEYYDREYTHINAETVINRK